MSDPSEASEHYDRATQEPADPEPPTSPQRLRITVPELKTSITMGAGAAEGQLYAEDPNEILHFPGFGVTTRGDLHLEARGPAATSRVKLQTNGEISIHSNQQRINIGAKEGIAVGTDRSATMWGAQGTALIGGGFGPLGTLASSVESGLQDPERSQHPATPEWVGSLDTLSTALGIFSAVAGKFAGNRVKVANRRKKDQRLEDVKIEEARKPAEYLEMLSTGLGLLQTLYSMSKADPLGVGSAWDQLPSGAVKDAVAAQLDCLPSVLAGTQIIGQAGVSLMSPNTVSVLGLGGVGISGRLSASLTSDLITSVTSDKAVSLIAGENMEGFASKNLTLASSVVTRVGSNARLSLSGKKVATLVSNGRTGVYAKEWLTLVSAGSALQLTKGDHDFTSKGLADFDGEQGVAVRSTSGNAALISHEKTATMMGKKSATVQSGDALIKLEPGTIALTVDGDAAEAKAAVADYYEMKLEGLEKKWNEAAEKLDLDEYIALHDSLKKVREERDAKLKEYDDIIDGQSPNFDNGIKIESSGVTLSVGGDSIKLKSGKVEVLKALVVKG